MPRAPYPDQVDNETEYELSIDEWVDKQAKAYIAVAYYTADLYLGGAAK